MPPFQKVECPINRRVAESRKPHKLKLSAKKGPAIQPGFSFLVTGLSQKLVGPAF